MDTHRAERPQTLEASAVLVDGLDETSSERTAVAAQRSRQDEWRWIPDPADAPPAAQHGPWRSGLLVQALAWVSVQYRA